MKIAHIVSTFPPNIGGMGSVCKNEAQLLSENGHDVTVFTLKYPKTVYDDTIYPFSVTRLTPFPRLGNGGFVPQSLAMLGGFDVVHLHYPFYGLVLPPGLPLVVTYHMDARPSGFLKKSLQKFYDMLFARRIIKSAKKIIVVDKEYLMYSQHKQTIGDNFVEIPNGVDLKVFKPIPTDLIDVNLEYLAGKKIFLFVANPTPLKRLDLALGSMKMIDDPCAHMVVVGGGYDLEKYKKIAGQLGVREKVTFVGECPNDLQLSDYYNTSMCLVMPSDYESFALVVVEAMACGLPVIGTDIPGIRSKIECGASGLLFAKGSIDSLADKMKKVLAMTPEQLKEMGRKGRVKVMEKYSWETHMKKLEELYKNV